MKKSNGRRPVMAALISFPLVLSGTAGVATAADVTEVGAAVTHGGVAELSATVGASLVQAAPLTSTATLVRETPLFELVPPSPDPSGIVYMDDLDQFLVVDSEVEEMVSDVPEEDIYRGVNLWQLSRDGSTVHETANTLKFSDEPTGIGYDPARRRAFISDDGPRRIYEITVGADDRFGTPDDVVTSFATRAYDDLGNQVGNDDPEDVTYDTASGDLFITQGVGAEVWRVSPGPNGRFDGASGDDTVSHFDVGAFGVGDLEGIGYSAVRDSLFLADRKTNDILEVSKTGALVQKIDASGLGMNHPAGIAVAPSSTDDGSTSLYVVTRGRDNDNFPTENDGVMYEMSAPYLGPRDNAAPSVDAGADQSVVLPGSASLDGAVLDDGLPSGSSVSSEWSQTSGPGTVTFGNETAVDTSASFSAAGTYVLTLTATDGELSESDELTVTVSSAPPPPPPPPPGGGGGGGGGTPPPANTAPTVGAGADATATQSGPVSLNGTVTDDGMPNPPGAVSTTWSKVSGPGTVTFANAAAVDTRASFSETGTYTLRLTATDSALSGSDDVMVTVRDGDLPGDGAALSARLRHDLVPAGARTAVVGRVTPAAAGQPLRLQRWNGSAWRTVAKKTLSAGASVAYRFPVRHTSSGVYRYQVVAPAYAGLSRTVSPGDARGLTLGVYRAQITRVQPAGDEFVTVKNTGAISISLEGWKLKNARTGRTVTLPAFTLRPGRIVRVHTGSGASDGNDLYLGSRPMWGAHATAVLRDSLNRRAARLRY